MNRPHSTLLAAALCLLTASSLLAQRPAEPTGHWTGTLQAPSMEVPFEIDLVKSDDCQFGGTVNLPVERIKGLPLLNVTCEGSSVSFYARADQPMRGTLSPDGQTISGDYFAGGNTVPFSMTRSGDARIDPP